MIAHLDPMAPHRPTDRHHPLASARPAIWEATVGAFDPEPDPLPAGDFDGHAFDGDPVDVEQCVANPESGGPFTYPGAIYPALPADLAPDGGPHRYIVPLREDIGSVLPAASSVCGLPSDPPR